MNGVRNKSSVMSRGKRMGYETGSTSGAKYFALTMTRTRPGTCANEGAEKLHGSRSGGLGRGHDLAFRSIVIRTECWSRTWNSVRGMGEKD